MSKLIFPRTTSGSVVFAAEAAASADSYSETSDLFTISSSETTKAKIDYKNIFSWALEWFFCTTIFISFESLGMWKFASILCFSIIKKYQLIPISDIENSFFIDISWRCLKTLNWLIGLINRGSLVSFKFPNSMFEINWISIEKTISSRIKKNSNARRFMYNSSSQEMSGLMSFRQFFAIFSSKFAQKSCLDTDVLNPVKKRRQTSFCDLYWTFPSTSILCSNWKLNESAGFSHFDFFASRCIISNKWSKNSTASCCWFVWNSAWP